VIKIGQPKVSKNRVKPLLLRPSQRT